MFRLLKLLLAFCVILKLVTASRKKKDVIYVVLTTQQVRVFGSLYCGQLTDITTNLSCLAEAQFRSPLVVGYNSKNCKFCEVQSTGTFATLENTFADNVEWYFVKGKHEFHETCHSVMFQFMKKDSKRCCETTMSGSIHTKDESKRGSAFAFIFGVN